MAKLADFCLFNLDLPLLPGHLSTKIGFKSETSAENTKIAESAYLAHFPA